MAGGCARLGSVRRGQQGRGPRGCWDWRRRGGGEGTLRAHPRPPGGRPGSAARPQPLLGAKSKLLSPARVSGKASLDQSLRPHRTSVSLSMKWGRQGRPASAGTEGKGPCAWGKRVLSPLRMGSGLRKGPVLLLSEGLREQRACENSGVCWASWVWLSRSDSGRYKGPPGPLFVFRLGRQCLEGLGEGCCGRRPMLCVGVGN